MKSKFHKFLVFSNLFFFFTNLACFFILGSVMNGVIGMVNLLCAWAIYYVDSKSN